MGETGAAPRAAGPATCGWQPMRFSLAILLFIKLSFSNDNRHQDRKSRIKMKKSTARNTEKNSRRANSQDFCFIVVRYQTNLQGI